MHLKGLIAQQRQVLLVRHCTGLQFQCHLQLSRKALSEGNIKLPLL